MGDEWRRKTFYKKRVLIDTQRVLDPQFDDGLICITGAELEMLRNLMQYLHRRSTFAESISDVGYFAPDTADWDTIQAIVANLEEKIMGCEELMQVFTDMLTAMQCVCDKAEQLPQDGGSVQPIVDVGLSDGVLIENDPYGVDTEVEARRCAIAQLTYWQAWELLTEIIQPLQENAMDFAVPAALTAIGIMVGVAALAIPAGALVIVLTLLIDVWVDGSLAAVQNAVVAHRDELICAVYQGLTYDYRMAETRASEVIEGIGEFSPIDALLARAMFSPWAMALASKAYTQGTDWAIANVWVDACDTCDWVYEMVYEFPLCPGDFTGGFPCYSGRWPGLNQSEDGYSPNFTIPDIGANVDIEVEVRYMSSHGIANTVGAIEVQFQDVALDWNTVGLQGCTTNVIAGAINIHESTSTDKNVTRNVLRVWMHGQAGQAETNPWPLMPSYIRVKIYPHV